MIHDLKIVDYETKESADPYLVKQSTKLLARWLVNHWMNKTQRLRKRNSIPKKQVVFYRRLSKIFQKGQQNETRRRISQTFHR